MTATTNADFDATTEANEVAAAFPEAIKGKTILITGVNVAGIGFSTAEALVRLHSPVSAEDSRS